jgi:hypothetical protein
MSSDILRVIMPSIQDVRRMAGISKHSSIPGKRAKYSVIVDFASPGSDIEDVAFSTALKSSEIIFPEGTPTVISLSAITSDNPQAIRI